MTFGLHRGVTFGLAGAHGRQQSVSPARAMAAMRSDAGHENAGTGPAFVDVESRAARLDRTAIHGDT